MPSPSPLPSSPSFLGPKMSSAMNTMIASSGRPIFPPNISPPVEQPGQSAARQNRLRASCLDSRLLPEARQRRLRSKSDPPADLAPTRRTGSDRLNQSRQQRCPSRQFGRQHMLVLGVRAIADGAQSVERRNAEAAGEVAVRAPADRDFAQRESQLAARSSAPSRTSAATCLVRSSGGRLTPPSICKRALLVDRRAAL